jgi:predicted nuclease of predicted toxin-antitoxin system
VKFLVDAQLPPRLTVWLAERGHEAVHVSALPDGLRMPDTEL